MERKEFLKISCAVLGLGGIAGLHSGCAAFQVYNTEAIEGQIKIPLSEFLMDKIRLLRVPQFSYDILVRKIADDRFLAILMMCTHHDWALTPSKNEFHCTYHGSVFDLEGRVLAGPAEKNLKSFKTRIDNGMLILT